MQTSITDFGQETTTDSGQQLCFNFLEAPADVGEANYLKNFAETVVKFLLNQMSSTLNLMSKDISNVSTKDNPQKQRVRKDKGIS